MPGVLARLFLPLGVACAPSPSPAAEQQRIAPVAASPAATAPAPAAPASAPAPAGDAPVVGPTVVAPVVAPRFTAAEVLTPCDASVLVTLAETDERDRSMTIERTVTRWTERFTEDFAGGREPIAAPVPVARETLIAAGGRVEGSTVVVRFDDDIQPLVYRFDARERTIEVAVDPAHSDESLRFRYRYTCRPPAVPRQAEVVMVEVWRRSKTVGKGGSESAPWTHAEFGAFLDRRPVLGGVMRVALPGGRALDRRIVAIESLAVSTGFHIELEPSDDPAILAARADPGRREELPFDAAGVYPTTARPKLALVDRDALTGPLPVPIAALQLAIDLDGDATADQLVVSTSPERELGCRTTFERKGGRWRARPEQCGD